MTQRQLFSETLAVFITACMLMSSELAASGREDKAPLRLVAITSPIGSGMEAGIAHSLVPVGKMGEYELSLGSAIEDPGKKSNTQTLENHAKQIAESAREAALAFHLVEAAGLWRQAADDLVEAETRILNPALVATYQLEAGAASAEAGETDLALQYFRRALAVDSDIRPGPEISPGAKDLFESALAKGPVHLGAPPNRILLPLCTRWNVDGILWIAVGRDKDGLVVSDKLLLRGEKSGEPEVSHHPPMATGALDEWITKERTRLGRIILPKEPNAGEAEVKKSPWAKAWWLYTAVGVAAIIGVGVAIATTSDPPTADVVVHH
ncbi:MAG: hypothetical protein GY854_04345 [Deltaproteobacteria bacterium]|nr:hypothetical protein [Deltaproteobacteria bacterium]